MALDGLAAWPVALTLAAAFFGAAVVRGYSGFGFAAIVLGIAALVTDPVPLIPVIFILEIVMSAAQARSLRGHVDWSRLLWLWAGAVIAMPVAILVLLALPETIVRLGLSALIGAMALVLLTGWTLRRPLPPPAHAAVGIVAGIANAVAVGGLPVAASLAAQPLPPAVFRATMIVFLAGIDIVGLPIMAWGGNVGLGTFQLTALAAPIVGLGLWLGNRRFLLAPPAAFRRFAMWLLLALSVLGLVKGLA
ncbi:sulfite exporter TauE/SafE family protein [Salipiger sp. IMCC34102]|nr:sulfite exporter TauE/SafE family protein [Salipiger sp. IMCC34102]RYH02433.1 sulfite exporter TauE/SafE family protein [Salipiger sp. IMCC34102]